MRLWYRILWIAARVMAYALFQFRVIGQKNIPKMGRAIIASNHQSYFDPFFIQIAIDREPYFMAKKSLFSNIFLEAFFSLFNAFPIARGEIDIKGINYAIEILKKEKLLVIFPEGTRSENGNLQEMKRGVDILARRAQSPVIPIFIDGTFRLWPKRSKLPLFTFGKVRVIIGQKIPPEICKIQKISDKIYSCMKELMAVCDKL